MIKRTAIALLLAISLSYAANAQQLNKAKLDSFFYALSTNNKSMGSIAISSNGVLVYQKAIGYSGINGDVKTPSTIKTKYRIGSITKMFTGTMIFELIEEGKLNFTTPLSTYYPQVPNAAKITIGQMLHHRSGLHNFTSDFKYNTYKGQPKTEAEMLAIIEKQHSDFEPGTKAEYSNTNFVLLGYIVEKITGKPYAEELKKRITSKIGLRDTYYGGPANIAKNEARSFTFKELWKAEPETDMSIPGGAGAIVSTPADLDHFIEALFAGKLISKSSLDSMKTIKDGYGKAIFAIPFYAKKGFGHNGGIDAFSSLLIYFPEDKIAISYLSNGRTFSTNDVLIGALTIYFNMPYNIPEFKNIQLKTEDLDKYLGNYSSSQIPLKIAVTKNNTTLIAQATGQGPLELEATDTNKFIFRAANIVMLFDPAKKTFNLAQNGQNYLFTRDN
ncbi:serine hydrolase domain-containing protein [Mucilaginibacter sp.]|uniref:serine hydrolase domain-containing protein n=1 Tax=Mucilaginibacter sp. TaxID=1882438 RepID=UPI003D11C947